jgi:hypothetical protein
MKIRLLVISQAALVILLIAAVASHRVPLGIPGEWEWLRVRANPPWISLILAALGVACFCGLAALGLRTLLRPTRSAGKEALWLFILWVSSIAVQVIIPTGAADEYDLTKWAYVNVFTSSTGYYRIAKEQAVGDPLKFLADYPEWIKQQDSLHIGTHPPGLIALQCVLIKTMERYPRLADALSRTMPHSTWEGFRQLEVMERKPIPRADRAAIYLTSLIVLMACAGTVVPLYLLARSAMSSPASWAIAALWPLAPAANLFQPDADAAYPFLSASALALAAWASKPYATPRASTYQMLAAVACGLILAFGNFFTLAFLPVGLIVGLLIAFAREIPLARRAVLVVAVGAGFLSLIGAGWLITGANPFAVWQWNLKHHARFYDEYPRTYLAWLLLNPVELAIAMGLPTAIWCLVGLAYFRRLPRITWITLGVLLLVNLTGRNMGEVARLWMFFIPPCMTAAGIGFDQLGSGPKTLVFTMLLVGLQTLALQAMIQVVYPI